MKGLVPRSLALSGEPEERLFYSNWTPSMHAWAAAGWSEDFRSQHAVAGSPDPALRIVGD